MSKTAECVDLLFYIPKWIQQKQWGRFRHAEALREVGPKCLNAHQKRQRCQSPDQLLELFRLASRLVTMDETWLYHYDPDTKEQSMEETRQLRNVLVASFH
jgi:hypothetical protein